MLVNPVVEVLDATTEGGWEGCLPVPGLRGWVDRAAHVRYSGTGLDGARVEWVARGFHARVVQVWARQGGARLAHAWTTRLPPPLPTGSTSATTSTACSMSTACQTLNLRVREGALGGQALPRAHSATATAVSRTLWRGRRGRDCVP